MQDAGQALAYQRLMQADLVWGSSPPPCSRASLVLWLRGGGCTTIAALHLVGGSHFTEHSQHSLGQPFDKTPSQHLI